MGQGVDRLGRSCALLDTFLHDELEFFLREFTVHLELTVEEVQNLVCILGRADVVCNTREVAIGILHEFLDLRLDLRMDTATVMRGAATPMMKAMSWVLMCS